MQCMLSVLHLRCGSVRERRIEPVGALGCCGLAARAPRLRSVKVLARGDGGTCVRGGPVLALCLWLAHRAGSESRPLSSASTRALLSVRGAFGEDLFERIELERIAVERIAVERIAVERISRKLAGIIERATRCSMLKSAYPFSHVVGLMLDLSRAYRVDLFVRQAYHE